MTSNRSLALRPRRRRAFTLLEMMVVVGIIALIIGAGIVAVSGAYGDAQKTTTRAHLKEFETALEMYRMRHGRYPKTTEGLAVLVTEGYVKDVPKDPWGEVYVYEYPAKINKKGYDLYSKGENPEDKADDIGNWATPN